MKSPMPTLHEIERAHEAFRANEPRDLFYKAATELVRLALCGKTALTVPEALAVLLLTWNRAYYQYKKATFDEIHFTAIEHTYKLYRQPLLDFRQRTIESLCDQDCPSITRLFEDFEAVLGPVGTAKCLHLLAPDFFPLWDREIARVYRLSLRSGPRNGALYCRFMVISKEQYVSLGGRQILGRNPLKAIDEFNYCRYTKGWI